MRKKDPAELEHLRPDGKNHLPCFNKIETDPLVAKHLIYMCKWYS